MLKWTNIIQSCSKAHIQLGSLTVTCFKNSVSCLPRSSQIMSNTCVLMNRESMFNLVWTCFLLVIRTHLVRHMILDGEFQYLRHTSS